MSHDEPLRNETEGERLDRNWAELLQEMRVMQTGVQLIAGFLLTLPFQPAFSHLDQLQRGLYLILVVLSGGTTALMLVPIAVHRRLFGQHVKQKLVSASHTLVRVALMAIGLVAVGIVTLVFDVVLGRGPGAVTLGVSLVVVLVLLLVVPWRVARADD
ncbi:DUF6328 family protein [Nocardioides sp.]|uniref:DUF6328 family protein n=1 Tax=Nocardioides sp. TaxID=35761 RepID=UPI002732BA48|nr:DUF6328 family protein [Nocardioides sp.]MDP3890976.1 DUF6328 family protein [Nocardioides sp.]